LLVARAGLLLVREAAEELRGEPELRVGAARAARPVGRLAPIRNPVEGRVDLVRVKERGHRGEPVEPARRTARIDDAFPVLVGPAGAADANEAISHRPSAFSQRSLPGADSR